MTFLDVTLKACARAEEPFNRQGVLIIVLDLSTLGNKKRVLTSQENWGNLLILVIKH